MIIFFVLDLTHTFKYSIKALNLMGYRVKSWIAGGPP